MTFSDQRLTYVLWVIFHRLSLKHKIDEINQLNLGGAFGEFFKLCIIYKRERNQSPDHDHFFVSSLRLILHSMLHIKK